MRREGIYRIPRGIARRIVGGHPSPTLRKPWKDGWMSTMGVSFPARREPSRRGGDRSENEESPAPASSLTCLAKSDVRVFPRSGMPAGTTRKNRNSRSAPGAHPRAPPPGQCPAGIPARCSRKRRIPEGGTADSAWAPCDNPGEGRERALHENEGGRPSVGGIGAGEEAAGRAFFRTPEAAAFRCRGAVFPGVPPGIVSCRASPPSGVGAPRRREAARPPEIRSGARRDALRPGRGWPFPSRSETSGGRRPNPA